MKKTLEFADLLNSLKAKRETQIIHDLSNKFNLLTLAFEEIEDLVAEEGPIEKKVLKEEVLAFKKAKDKYLDCSDRFKIQSNLSQPELVAPDDILDQVKACLQKDLVKQGVTPTVLNHLGRENLAFIPTFSLLSCVIMLRLFLEEKALYGIELIDLESFIKNEKSICDKYRTTLSPRFEESYIDYLTGLWAAL